MSRSEIVSKLLDSSRIGSKMAEQIRHQRDVIQVHVREKNELMRQFVKLENDFKAMEEINLKLREELLEERKENEALSKQILEGNTEAIKLQQVIDELKRQLDDFHYQKIDEEKKFRRRIDDTALESERLAKENISLRMYVSRLEAEVEISRKSFDEIALSRQRDGRLIESQRVRIESLTGKCQELEETNHDLESKLAQQLREKSKTLAALEVTLNEKDRNISMLENSLKIAVEEVSCSEKGFVNESQELSSQVFLKNEEIKSLHAKLRALERDKENDKMLLDTCQRKYKDCKKRIRDLMETVRTYEETFETIRFHREKELNGESLAL